jgi:hypothetical protein
MRKGLCKGKTGKAPKKGRIQKEGGFLEEE